MTADQRCKHCGYTREEHDDPSEFVPQELFTSNQRLECITLPNNSVVIDGTAYDHLAQVAQENVNLRAQLSCATAELAWAEECGRKRDAGETDALERVQQARLTWAVACPCSCDACEDFHNLVRDVEDSAPPEKAVETASPQAPIATLIVTGVGMPEVRMYAPGLPLGEHDVYCEPEGVAPYMRAEKAAESWHPCGCLVGTICPHRHAGSMCDGLITDPETGLKSVCPECYSKKAAEKRAYHETHEAPHCPTCECGAQKTDAARAALAKAAGLEPPCDCDAGWDEDGCCLICGADVPEAHGLSAKANAHDSWCLCSDCLDKRGRQEAAEKTSPAHECEFIPFQNAPGYEMCPGCSAVRPTSPRRGEQP